MTALHGVLATRLPEAANRAQALMTRVAGLGDPEVSQVFGAWLATVVEMLQTEARQPSDAVIDHIKNIHSLVERAGLPGTAGGNYLREVESDLGLLFLALSNILSASKEQAGAPSRAKDSGWA